MGIERAFEKVKLFAGYIYRDEEIFLQTRERLVALFSPPDLQAGPFDFDFTTYYNIEMGTPLFKRFMAFTELIEPIRLPEIKRLTNEIENETARSGNRLINIDPGYLWGGNVILATTKGNYHRVALADGIYAHMEYVIKKNRVVPLEWTYPDFRSQPYMDFFNELILLYKQNSKGLKHNAENPGQT